MRWTAACVAALVAAAMPAGAIAAGNPAAGEAVYERCSGCHSLERDRTGPRHCGLVGRKAGSVEGFAYTEAMKRARIVWTEAALEGFLADPGKVVPGTAMAAFGVADPRERADLIAWLALAPRCP